MRDSSFKHVLKHVETENHLRRVPSRKKTYLILEQFATQTQCSINFKEAKLKKKKNSRVSNFHPTHRRENDYY